MLEILKNLKAVTFALDNVEVKGRSNMDNLLAAIQTLDRCIAELDKIRKELEQPVTFSVTTEEPKEAKE